MELANAKATGPNHFFINYDDIPYKIELGGKFDKICAYGIKLKLSLEYSLLNQISLKGLYKAFE